MKTLKFYDFKKREAFFSSEYKVTKKKTSKGIRYFAIAVNPSGNLSYRLISGKDQ